mgnify:CR=1 FL=1
MTGDTAVTICSQALRELGENGITALTENSTAGRLCNALYDKERRKELRAHRWNFAIKRVALAQLGTAPAFGYSYAYTLPSDALRILEEQYHDTDFKVENQGGVRVVVTDSGTFNALYVANITDPTLFDADFVDAFVARMKWKMAYPITGSAAKEQQAKADYETQVKEARSIDAQEGIPDSIESNTLTGVRQGWDSDPGKYTDFEV